MIIIVGLGNPGQKFNHTRHNAGFEALDFFAKKNEFPKFEFSKKHHSLISVKTHAHILKNVSMEKMTDEKVILAKPQTFMNDSGLAVKKLLSNVNCQLSNVIVVHDDIDIELGKLKISKDSGAGGHKGVESIINTLGTKDFIRLKIGVAADDKLAEEVVLKKFTPEEQKMLKLIIEKTSGAIEYLIKNGLEKTMNKYNKSLD